MNRDRKFFIDFKLLCFFTVICCVEAMFSPHAFSDTKASDSNTKTSGDSETTISHEALLDQAIQTYREALNTTDRDARLQQFRQAEMLFSQLADTHLNSDENANNAESESHVQGIRNADLYVNLGNAALQAERLGPAILAYRKALLLDPNHPRAAQNLEHARKLIPDGVKRSASVDYIDSFFFWNQTMSFSERAVVAAVFFFLACMLIAVSIRWAKPWIRYIALIPALGWLVIALSLSLELWNQQAQEAVILTSDVIARSADYARAPARFSQPLTSGIEVSILEKREDWSHIQLSNGRDGWVPSSSLGIVAFE